jgi:molybdenum cofactor biosynthesis protein B
LRYLIITVSTSRYNRRTEGKPVADESGDLAQEMILRSNGLVAERELIPDDARVLKYTVSRALEKGDLDVIVMTGGTGVSTTDVTIESVRPFFEKEIEGFGEVFRSVSFEKIGAAAALSRATAGVAKGKLIMCLPGSPDAVGTALGLFLEEVPHVLRLARGR